MAPSLAGLDDILGKLEIRLSVGGGLPGFDRCKDALAAHPNEALPDRLEALPMLYSSGTTGRPKRVKPKMTGDPLGHGEALTALVRVLFGANQESIYLSPAPLYHSAPLRYCTQFHRLGATVVILEKFDAEGALAAIEKFQTTHSQRVPTINGSRRCSCACSSSIKRSGSDTTIRASNPPCMPPHPASSPSRRK